MKILVTGGAGFIGSHIVDKLVIDGCKVRVVDNMSSGRLENLKHWLDSKSVELLVGDLREPEVALRAVDGVNVVFHFAANPEVRLSTTDPEVHFNKQYSSNIQCTRSYEEEGRRGDSLRIFKHSLRRTGNHTCRRGGTLKTNLSLRS